MIRILYVLFKQINLKFSEIESSTGPSSALLYSVIDREGEEINEAVIVSLNQVPLPFLYYNNDVFH